MPGGNANLPTLAPVVNRNLTSPWRRRLASLTAVVFVLSSLFPLGAGLSHDTASFPWWWGPVDVAVAAILASLTVVLFVVCQGHVTKTDEERSYRGYRVLIHGIFVLNVAVLFSGDRIVWGNCLPGFAWRYWLLLYSLPTWLAVLRSR
jgi:hypothetical protein